VKVLLAPVGSRGDVQPLVALATGLRAAGHEVLLTGPPNFRGWIEGLGFKFQGVGFDIERWAAEQAHVGRHPLKGIRALSATLRNEVRAQFDGLREVAPGFDVIVGAGIQAGAPSVADLLGVPYRHVLYVPTLLKTRTHAPILFPWQNMPTWLNRLGWRVMEAAYDRLLVPAINSVRRNVGLAPINNLFPYFLGEHTLIASDPILSEVGSGVSHPYTQVGALLLSQADVLTTELEAFLQAGPAPVYIGFGSIPDSDPRQTTKLIVSAVRRAGARAIISRGWAHLAEETLPPGFLAVGPTPHAKLFPRCAAIVHHAGAGTTTAAARAGRPQIAIPHGADQYYWGDRIVKLGLGPASINRPSLRERPLAAALTACLTDARMQQRAAELAGRLEPVNGVAATMRHLEGLVGGQAQGIRRAIAV
jgi:UDP:flavonoid glycosyltransferase YjiC (YdhE family)